MSFSGNYFQLFGLPVTHQMDQQRLDAEYEKLSLETHPDFFTQAPPEEQQEAHRRSAQVNEGYRILGNESRRAAYLLGLLVQQAEGGVELNQTALPDGFLQEMFFLQEELEEFDPAADPHHTEKLRAQFRERLESVATERGQLFTEALREVRQETLQAIQTNLNCEKYLLRLMERLG